MKKNALIVMDEVVCRIDGASAPGEFIFVYKTPFEDEQFFFNKKYIKRLENS